MQQFCDIFGKKGDAWHMILGDNPAGHSFVLRDLGFSWVFLNKSQLCKWMHAAGKMFVKTYLKAIR